jgi:hypothetical protein
MTRYNIMLAARVGAEEWRALRQEQRGAIIEDFDALLREEYDVPDDTMPDCMAEENAREAARVYMKRIGKGNLSAYADCLLAGQRHRAGE